MPFSFKLKGSNWIGLYFAVLVFYMIPAVVMQFSAVKLKANPGDTMLLLKSLLLMVVAIGSLFILATPILKKIIGATSLGEKQFVYSGKTGEFLWLNISNIFLSVITIGIYFPWYTTNLMKYLIGKTSCNGVNFTFNGRALHLLAILAATLLLPMILYAVVVATLSKATTESLQFTLLSQALLMLLMIPYMYFVYKWMFNVSYKEFRITWETDTGASINILLVQFLISIVTLGIYFPVASARLYEYFIRQTVFLRDKEKVYSLDARIDAATAFKTIWVQFLLTIVTAGIYGAWAYCNVLRLFIDNTSLIKSNSSTSVT